MKTRRIFNPRLGPLFKQAEGNIRFSERNDGGRRASLFLFLIVSLCLGIGLFMRLFQLAIVRGDYFRRLSESNRLRPVIIEPQRGPIVDRKGIPLATSREPNMNSEAKIIGSQRVNSYPLETAHIVGYRQVADTENIKNDPCVRKLFPGEKVGKRGIEHLFDCDLRGIPGKKLIETDALGRAINTVAVVPPVSGKTIRLALDVELQRIAYDALGDRKGTVIVTNPKTGEILSLLSSPSFDPEAFEKGESRALAYLANTEKPLVNRVSEGVYPPGSLFKLVVAAGGLQDGVFNKETEIIDNGYIMAGPTKFGNWYYLQYGKTEGAVNVTQALKRSNDIYFYKAGESMGPERIKKWASRFGFGTKTNYGLEEVEGTVPSAFWKNEALKERWYLGDTYNYSIGQGYLLTTPLQVAMMSNVFANGGRLCQPKLIKNGFFDLSDPSEGKAECVNLPLSSTTLETVVRGMIDACSPGGTGWPLFDFSVPKNAEIKKKLEGIDNQKKRASMEAQLLRNPLYRRKIATACKTGTAESHAKSGMPHAWFTVFAPIENPEVSITVLVEEGGQGSDVAAPIAGEILSAYFSRNE